MVPEKQYFRLLSFGLQCVCTHIQRALCCRRWRYGKHTKNLGVYVCVHTSISISVSSVPCPGLLECCCGKYFLSGTCHIPARATRKFWSLSPVEDGWTHLRTAPGLCTTFQNFLLETEHGLVLKYLDPHMPL